ncbi:MAG: GNAT family N-acetyltransferase, partial [Alphaproteobacteria bacterium]
MHDRKRLVPDDFAVPEGLEHPRFLLRMLTVNDVIKDYDAVMTSIEHLQNTYSAESDGVWPEGLSLEDDLVDLGWHQREFTMGYSFAYTMMSIDESR